MANKGSKCKPATAAEKKWIEEFKKVCNKCPKSLWLYSASGKLKVMKTPEDNNENIGSPFGEGVNPENIIADISGIKNDGGDW